jgi:hypothetical protein
MVSGRPGVNPGSASCRRRLPPRPVCRSCSRRCSNASNCWGVSPAVADGKRFWLSSGNWQHSNQPEISPLTKPADVPEMKKRNREWHVIVDHQGLADMFERFIEYDRGQSKPFDNIPKKLRCSRRCALRRSCACSRC